MTYYNTTNESGQTLIDYRGKTKSQDQIVLSIFKTTGALTPSSVWVLFKKKTGKDVPITSIRRSITNLTKEGRLEKTENKALGMYGRNEYRWKLK